MKCSDGIHGTILVDWPRYRRKVMNDLTTLKCTRCRATFDLPDRDGHELHLDSRCPGYDKNSSALGSCGGTMVYGKTWVRVGSCDCGGAK